MPASLPPGAAVGAEQHGQEKADQKRGVCIKRRAEPTAGVTTADTTQPEEVAASVRHTVSTDALPLPGVTLAPRDSVENRGSQTGGVGEESSAVVIVGGTMVKEEDKDIATALYKIQALTGMVRAQVGAPSGAAWG